MGGPHTSEANVDNVPSVGTFEPHLTLELELLVIGEWDCALDTWFVVLVEPEDPLTVEPSANLVIAHHASDDSILVEGEIHDISTSWATLLARGLIARHLAGGTLQNCC